MKKVLLFIYLISQANIFCADKAEEVKKKKEISPKKVDPLIEVNKKFEELKNSILDLKLEDQFNLAVNLLHQLNIEISMEDVPDMQEQIKEIDDFAKLVSYNENKEFQAYLLAHRGESADRLIKNIGNILNYMNQKPSLKRQKLDAYRAFYEIIYENLKKMKNEISSELSKFISSKFRGGIMYNFGKSINK